MLTMEEAMKQSGSLPFAAGNIVKGAVIEVRPKEVLVDIGYKSEGVIPPMNLWTPPRSRSATKLMS